MGVSIFDDPVFAGLYADAEIAAHLSPEAQIAAMIRFEAALAEAEAASGVIPAEAGAAINAALSDVRVTPSDLTEGTRSAGVPVPALVARLRSSVGPPHGQYIHWGATSQDVLDTGLVLRLAPVLETLEDRLSRLVARLVAEAERYARTPMVGRTRSQIAAPTTLGLRIAGWAAPLARCRSRLRELRPRLLVVQLGGATGSLSVLGAAGPLVTDALADALGLHRTPKPWGTERDGLAELSGWLALVSGLLGRVAGDLILMGRSESAELSAGIGGGSSTMPQKANPVQAETVLALARHTMGAQATMLQALLHQEERDGAAWAAEWMVLPQMLVATGAALTHMLALAENLRPNPERLEAALSMAGGAAHAEALAFALARQMPLPEAQALLKQAARQVAEADGTLLQRLEPLLAERGFRLPEINADETAGTAEALIARFADHVRSER